MPKTNGRSSGKPNRKPPASVQTIDGSDPALDAIIDKDYAEAIAVQDAVLFAQARERKVLGNIRSRLLMGARDAGTKYYFDEVRGIVRRRESQETGS